MEANKSITKRKTWIIAIVVILSIMTIIGFVFKRDISVKYYDLINNHFKRGDKVYMGKTILDIPGGNVRWLRLIRPLTKEDIDVMTIAPAEKQSLINLLDPTLKPYLIQSNKKIENDSLFKNKSAYLGKYLYHKTLDYHDDYHKIKFIDNFYAIEPDYLGYIDESLKDDNNLLPKGFTWADNTLYFHARWVSDKESPLFKK